MTETRELPYLSVQEQLEAAYAELRKLSGTLGAVYDRDVYLRAELYEPPLPTNLQELPGTLPDRSSEMRGALTERVQEKAKEVLGREISLRELRLMPYLQFVLMNNQRLEPHKINQEEREILSSWREAGWLEGGASGVAVTKQFWDALNELLWLSYVDCE